MKVLVFRGFSILSLLICLFACSNTVKFTYEDPYAPYVGDTITIRGYLSKPEGEGPFPAVILQHGCSGITDRARIWASVLKNWGYVTFIVDSNGPRRVSNGCDGGGVPIDARAYDAYEAMSYLRNVSYVDANRIALMGFSQGGNTVLCAINSKCLFEKQGGTFKAAIAFYPSCTGSLKDNNAPLMVLIGEKDDWTPASRCHHMDRRPRGQHEATFVFYPNAYHCFDWPGKNGRYREYRLLYDWKATADARMKVKSFLSKYLM